VKFQSKQRFYLYAVYFHTVYKHTRTPGILGNSALLSLGKVYYDPKHSAGFGSVSKLVKARKNKRSDVEE
jgi:hypothetical protein